MKKTISLVEQRTAVTATIKLESEAGDNDKSNTELVLEARNLFEEAYAVAHQFTIKKNL